MKNKAVLFRVILAIGSCLAISAQGHGHLNVGAEARDQDSPLIFENGAVFATDSAYVKTLNFATGGKYTGFYEGNMTLTALHSTNAFGEIEEDSPAPGSFIVAEIVSVEGPSGGSFGFWDVDSTTAPTHSIPAGTTNGAFRFDLSSSDLGAGQPGGDPFGHIHGRRFTATKPGLYTVGFRAVDTSRNGSANGPIHTHSTVLHIYFQAGVNVVEVREENGTALVTAALPLNFQWQLESKDSLEETNWLPVSAPILGADALAEVGDNRGLVPARFYRLSGMPVEP